jgi:murein DD-endopeptidase MepM/ murein hydrolase activator NlpD
VAIREGSITMSVWTPSEGNIVQIQHPDNMTSVYKGVSQVQRPLGSRVKGGEVIGVAGEVGEEGSETPRPFGFELWYNGTLVDPESYIVF